MADAYGLPDVGPQTGYSAGYDATSALDAFFNRVGGQPYTPPSLSGYATSRLTAPALRGTSPTAEEYQPPGPPIRFNFNILDELTNKTLESPIGVAAGLGAPEQRGGSVDFAGQRIATAPVNAQNFATYAREAPLAVITSILGHHYQQPGQMYESPAGPVNKDDLLRNIGQGDFPGVIDNIIDGLGAVGDAISKPIEAGVAWVRNDAARNRAEGVAEMFRSGHGTPSIVQFLTHIFDLNGLTTYDGIVRKAQEAGVTPTEMVAEMWNLDKSVVEAIRKNPNMNEDQLFELTKAEPFSYNAFESIVSELGINLAPLLIGAGEIRGAGLALRGIDAGRELGLTGGVIEGLTAGQGVGRFAALAERAGMWSMPQAWRWVRPVVKGAGAVTGFSPTGIKIGAGIRLGEWVFKQAGIYLGDQAIVDTADRWLYETPLSQNPGLMLVDAFTVHPIEGLKGAYRGARGAVVRIAGHGEEPVSPAFARSIGKIADVGIDELNARALRNLGWDEATVRGIFENPDSGVTVHDLKNGLYHVALQIVRDRHPESRLIEGGGVGPRAVEFHRVFGDEAAKLLRDEISGRGTTISDQIKGEFWTRIRTAEASELGALGGIGPYDPHTALVQFASWLRMSKIVQKALGGEYVPALRPDVNTSFLTAFREEIRQAYPKAGDTIRAGDLNRLATFVPKARRIAGLGPQRRVPKITRAKLEAMLDELESEQRVQDANVAAPRSERVPAIDPVDVENPIRIGQAFNLRTDTIRALQTATTEGGIDALGPIPGDLAKVLRKVYRLSPEEMARDPQAAWQRAATWYSRAFESAVQRGEAVATLDRFAAVIDQIPMRTIDRDINRQAMERVTTGIVHPYATVAGEPIPQFIADILARREERVAELVDRAQAWLDDPHRSMKVTDTPEGPVLTATGYHAGIRDAIEQEVGRVLELDRQAPLDGLTAEGRAILEDPAAHPLEKAAVLRDSGVDNLSEIVAGAPDLEGAYADQLARVLGPDAEPRPVARADVDSMTEGAIAAAKERDQITSLARDLALIVDHDPKRIMAPDVAELVTEADALGTTKIGKGTGPKAEVARWRSLPISKEGVRRVSNEARLRAMRTQLDATVQAKEAEVVSLASQLDLASARVGEKLTRSDFEWESQPVSSHRLKRDAEEVAKQLMADGQAAAVVAVPGPRGGKQWGVVRGTLRERPVSPVDAVRAQYDAFRARIDSVVAGGERSIAFADRNRANVEHLVSPDTRTGKWRITRVEDGTPVGHMEFDTFADAITQADRNADITRPIDEVRPAPPESPATPEAVQAAYDAGDIATGQELNRQVGVDRGGTPESGGAVKASPPVDATIEAPRGEDLPAVRYEGYGKIDPADYAQFGIRAPDEVLGPEVVALGDEFAARTKEAQTAHSEAQEALELEAKRRNRAANKRRKANVDDDEEPIDTTGVADTPEITALKERAARAEAKAAAVNDQIRAALADQPVPRLALTPRAIDPRLRVDEYHGGYGYQPADHNSVVQDVQRRIVAMDPAARPQYLVTASRYSTGNATIHRVVGWTDDGRPRILEDYADTEPTTAGFAWERAKYPEGDYRGAGTEYTPSANEWLPATVGDFRGNVAWGGVNHLVQLLGQLAYLTENRAGVDVLGDIGAFASVRRGEAGDARFIIDELAKMGYGAPRYYRLLASAPEALRAEYLRRFPNIDRSLASVGLDRFYYDAFHGQAPTIRERFSDLFTSTDSPTNVPEDIAFLARAEYVSKRYGRFDDPRDFELFRARGGPDNNALRWVARQLGDEYLLDRLAVEDAYLKWRDSQEFDVADVGTKVGFFSKDEAAAAAPKPWDSPGADQLRQDWLAARDARDSSRAQGTAGRGLFDEPTVDPWWFRTAYEEASARDLAQQVLGRTPTPMPEGYTRYAPEPIEGPVVVEQLAEADRIATAKAAAVEAEDAARQDAFRAHVEAYLSKRAAAAPVEAPPPAAPPSDLRVRVGRRMVPASEATVGQLEIAALKAVPRSPYQLKIRAELERRRNTAPPVGAGGAGNEVTFLDPQDNATPIRSRVVLVDAADVLTSDQPGFPANLQPRSRDVRASSDAQIREYAQNLQPDKLVGTTEGGSGMPVVTPEGAVLAGNGRIGAIRLASREQYAKYRNRLAEEASRHGLDPAAADAMERPVLVRELVDVDPVTQTRLAWQLNEMPLGDLAPAVASALTRADIARLEVGEEQALLDALHSTRNEAAVAQMIGRLPRDWQARYFDPKTGVNAQGARLLEGALLSKLLRADDRTLPGFEEARQVVFEVVEQEAEEIRRIAGGLAEAAGQMLKAQDKAEAGTIGAEFLQVTDDMVPALARIIALKKEGLNAQGILNTLDNVGAFDEFNLTGHQNQIARLLASSSSQREVREFLRRIAEAAEANAPDGGALFADQRLDATGILNAGIDRWNALRREAGRPELDHAPSSDAPYDTPLAGPRDLPDGTTATAPLQSQPVENVGAAISARAPGSHRVQAETLSDARGATERPADVEVRDPGERAFVEAYRADPDAVRADVEDAFLNARTFSDAEAASDYFAGLIESANEGTIAPGDWAVLRSILGEHLRRSRRGRINNPPVVRQEILKEWIARIDAGEAEIAADLAWLDRAVPDPNAARLVVPRGQDAIAEAELHSATGPRVPHRPDDPVAADLASTSEHTLTTDANPTVAAAVRRAIKAPNVEPPGQHVLEFNAPTGQAQVDRLTALAQRARAELDELRRQQAEFDVNPPIPPDVERGSVFADPEEFVLWEKLMTAGQDPIAAAVGAAEPRSLSEVMDAIQSIDRGAITDPVTGVGLTPEQATRLRATLMQLAQGTVAEARGAVKGANRARLTARVRRPDDFDADGFAASLDRLSDELAPSVISDPSLPKLDGFLGTQYVPSLPPTKAADGGALTPRLPYRDWLADADLVPGLREEITAGRMMEFGERVRRSRLASVVDHVIGPRSTREMRERAVAAFTRELEQRMGRGSLSSPELAKLERAVTATMEAWREHITTTHIGNLPFAIYRRIDLMGAPKMDRFFRAAMEQHFPEGLAALDENAGGQFRVDVAWRRADNRIRQFLMESSLPLTSKIERLYGGIADTKLGSTSRWVQGVYQILRFASEIRYLALELTEPIALGIFHGGVKPILEARTVESAARAAPPRAFGGIAQRAYMNSYAHWAQVADLEQVTPLRWRVIMRELARRQERPMAEALHEMLGRDPQLRRVMADLGDTPRQFLDRLDRDFQLLERGERQFASEAEAAGFFGPWLKSGVIDQPTFEAYVKAKRYTSHPDIERELARTSLEPGARVLYERLAQINHGLMHDLTATFFGQENRSNLQRVLNHPFLWWPVSYQIKATKWLARFMFQEAFGVDTGALGAVALERVYQQHMDRMRNDERYRRDLTQNATLYFLAQMLLPIAPWDIGVTLSPWTRMALSATGVGPHYERPFGVLGFGPFTTYGFAARAVRELSGQGLPFGSELEQLLPTVISTRKGKNGSTTSGAPTSQMGAELDRVGAGEPIPPEPVPPVTRLP